MPQTTLAFGSEGRLTCKQTKQIPPAPSSNAVSKATGSKRPRSEPELVIQGSGQNGSAPAMRMDPSETFELPLSDAEKRKAIWAQLQHQRATGVSNVVRGTGLLNVQNMERQILASHASRLAHAAHTAHPQVPKRSSSSNTAKVRTSEGWRKLPDGSSAYVTSGGKRLSGPAAFAAAARARK